MSDSKHGGARQGAGRPPKSIEHRKLFAGKVAIRIAPEAARMLQDLMLRNMPGVRTPEQMVEYLIRQAHNAPRE